MQRTILVLAGIAGLGSPGGRLAAQDAVAAFYAAREHRPAWVTERGLLPSARELVAVLDRATADGLVPGDYGVPALLTALERTNSAADRAELETRLTGVFLAFASDLGVGRVDPAEIDSMWTAAPGRAVDVAALAQALDAGSVAEVLHALRPDHDQYALLRLVLEWYRTIAARGGWSGVPTVRGVPDERALRTRLAASGDLGGGGFDSTLAGAVRRFQRRHGLAADGVVGPATLGALNVPVHDRIRQIELNLERWRWLPRDLGARHLAINIPASTLEVVEQGRTVLAMPVVVGRPDWQTPILSATVRQIVFGPAWNVPRTIAVQELVPLARADPGALARQHIRVFFDSGESRRDIEVSPDSVDWGAVTESTFAYRLVQDPGPGNPLGAVKLSFPNRFGVAAHDTPDHSLFGQPVRFASHGCVRLARATDLVNYLLRDVTPWTPDSVAAAMARPLERWISLPVPVPIHLVYGTAWVDDEGVLQFRPDVYGWDEMLARALAARAGAALSLQPFSLHFHAQAQSFVATPPGAPRCKSPTS